MKNYVLRGIFIFISFFVILGIILAFSLETSTSSGEAYNEEPMPTVDAVKEIDNYIKANLKYNFKYSEPNTSSNCLIEIEQCKHYIEFLENSLVNCKNTDIRKQVLFEILRINEIQKAYEKDHRVLLVKEKEQAKWQLKMEKYPIATEIWLYMKNELNWNNYVCAGVMGNLMVETGGGTLNLKWNSWDPPHQFYGICQWSKYYYPEVANTSLEIQLKYLKNTVQDQMNSWGRLYLRGFNYNQFIALEDARAAALSFAKCYERCASFGYKIRQSCAEQAYDFFVD